MAFKDFEELAEQVKGAGNVMACYMEELRDAYEAGRLGRIVVNAISDKLAQHGLGHVPKQLPTDQAQRVRIYKKGTPVGHLIEAVLEPTEEGDALLRSVAGSDAQATLQKVRELVCD